MNILIIGTGYVGLTHGTGLADLGNNVTCIDIDENKIEKLKNGVIPIYEPGLSELVLKNYEAGRLNFSTNLKRNIDNSEVIFIAVGTPSGIDGHADMSFIKQVAIELGQNMDSYKVIVTKSTVPVGTGDMIKEIIEGELRHRNISIHFDIVSNPEFLKEGSAVEDFKNGDRIIIGCNDENGNAVKVLQKLYSPLKNTQILVTDLYSAELIKYGANSLLAVEISFINAISRLCEKLGADVNKVSKGLKLDSRIGHKAFLTAGPGFGGSCFPKDVMEFSQTFRDNGIPNGILQAALEINNEQKFSIFTKIKNILGGDLNGKTIGILGLAFKADTDDIRYSSSIVVIDELLKSNVHIKCYDPKAMDNFKKFYPNLEYCSDIYDTISESDCMVIMTDWNDFKEPNWDKIMNKIRQKNIIDARNIYNKNELIGKGFHYVGVGI